MDPGIFTGQKNQFPLGMLITEVTFLPDDSAELFGFWYYRTKVLPKTGEEKRMVVADYAGGQCCQLKLIGNARQIADILLSCKWSPSIKDTWISSTEKLIEQAKKHVSIPIELDRLDKPKGIAISLKLSVRVRQELDEVIRKIHSGNNKVVLEIDRDWDLGKEVQNYLKSIAN